MERFAVRVTPTEDVGKTATFEVVDQARKSGEIYTFESLPLAEAAAETLNTMDLSGASDSDIMLYMKSVPGEKLL